MPVKKITDLTDIGTPASDDLLEIVDVSDTTDSPEGTSKKVLVSALGGGGGVTEFIELTDVPASYTGQASKVVAVKVDESGLEFVAGGGGTTPTLQEVLDEGKTATFTGVGGEDISINMGGDDGGGESADFVIISKIVGDDTFSTQRFQKQNIISYDSTIENSVTEETKTSGISLSDGEFSIEKQNSYNLGAKISSQFLQLEDIAEVDISGTELDVIFKPKPKFVSGTYYLVDEDYVTNAIAGVTTPDATPTVKGIAKLYTSLGSNTDGAVDQNTVNTALALKANAPLIDTVSSSALTGVTTEGILKSYLIPANTLTASEILNFANDLYKTGTAGTVTSRLYTNTTASLSGASLLATNISTAGNRKVPLRRQLVLKGGNIEVISAIGSLPDDNLNSSSVATLVTFNPAVDNYFITTAQNASAGDSTLQNNFKLHY